MDDCAERADTITVFVSNLSTALPGSIKSPGQYLANEPLNFVARREIHRDNRASRLRRKYKVEKELILATGDIVEIVGAPTDLSTARILDMRDEIAMPVCLLHHDSLVCPLDRDGPPKVCSTEVHACGRVRTHI